jgi:hypothetical protein
VKPSCCKGHELKELGGNQMLEEGDEARALKKQSNVD